MPPLCGMGKHVLRTGFLYAVQTCCICNGIRFIQADDRKIGVTADLDLPFTISEAKPSGRGERRSFRPALLTENRRFPQICIDLRPEKIFGRTTSCTPGSAIIPSLTPISVFLTSGHTTEAPFKSKSNVFMRLAYS